MAHLTGITLALLATAARHSGNNISLEATRTVFDKSMLISNILKVFDLTFAIDHPRVVGVRSKLCGLYKALDGQSDPVACRFRLPSKYITISQRLSEGDWISWCSDYGHLRYATGCLVHRTWSLYTRTFAGFVQCSTSLENRIFRRPQHRRE